MDTFHGISFHLTFTVAPENANEFLKRFGPIVDLVAAEPECEYFEVFQSPEQPGRFRVVEHWSKDKDWFMKVGLDEELQNKDLRNLDKPFCTRYVLPVMLLTNLSFLLL